MNHRKTVLILFGFAIVVGLIGLFDPISSHFCINDCDEFLFYLALSLSLLLITPILFFVRRETFVLWAKFAGVAFPVMLGILLYTFNNAPTPHGFGLAGLIPDEQVASATLPLFFVIISIILISVKSWKLRGR